MGNENIIMIAATEAQSRIDTSKPLEEQARAAMEVTKDFWLSTDEDVRFRGAVGALLLANQDNPEATERIKTEMRALNTLSAAMSGVPVDFAQILPELEEDFKPIGLRKLWMEIGHQA